MTLELRHLRCFVAIAEAGTITGAASRLHLTQPAVSRTLRQLERHLGRRLVDRSTHHLALTAAGHSFLRRAEAALNAVAAAFDPGNLDRAPLRFGHTWAALGRLTPVLLRRWRRAHPEVPLELLRVDEPLAGLPTGKVDVALVRGPEPGEVPGEVVFHEPRVAAVPEESPLATRGEIRMADLTSQTIVLNVVSGMTTLDMWPQPTRPSSTIEVGNIDDWFAAIAAGRGVGVTVPATGEIYQYAGVRYVPVADAPASPATLVWTDPPSHGAVEDLVTLVRDVVRG